MPRPLGRAGTAYVRTITYLRSPLSRDILRSMSYLASSHAIRPKAQAQGWRGYGPAARHAGCAARHMEGDRDARRCGDGDGGRLDGTGDDTLPCWRLLQDIPARKALSLLATAVLAVLLPGSARTYPSLSDGRTHGLSLHRKAGVASRRGACMPGWVLASPELWQCMRVRAHVREQRMDSCFVSAYWDTLRDPCSYAGREMHGGTSSSANAAAPWCTHRRPSRRQLKQSPQTMTDGGEHQATDDSQRELDEA
ncbi:hypothetical protein K466DRAFT_266310 [Polyporus arcularius HHB13444]|uniref:Uncharacterized protein n=1 Tax=Polyporus arcularius HHB13444 TaxID=1314778 RepID=A0A5C3PSA5_9APHY|nr:hypothetical protein K466DRAFT_266310 [Polyporus arcularius HHB13444]